MIELNFGPSEYVVYRPVDHIEPDMIITIPETGKIKRIPDYVLNDFLDQKEVKPYTFVLIPKKSDGKFDAVGFPLCADSIGRCDLENRIIMPWVEQRGEWVALYYHKWIESGASNDENYSGPFELNDYCKMNILEAYDRPYLLEYEGRNIYKDFVQNAGKMSPEQLRDHRHYGSYMLWAGSTKESYYILSSVIDRFNFESHGYKEEYNDLSPYYSGHEWSTDREERFIKTIKKDDRTLMTIEFSKKGYDTPTDIVFDTFSVSVRLEDPNEEILAGLFKEIDRLSSEKLAEKK